MIDRHLDHLAKGQVWGTSYGLIHLDTTKKITWLSKEHLRYRKLLDSGKWGLSRKIKIQSFRNWLYDHGKMVRRISPA